MMDPMSAEKRTAMFRYRLFRRITTLIRYLEAVSLTVVAVWSSSRIPTAAKASGDFLRQSIIPVLLGPRFLFLLGNAIVLTLLFKSRHLTADSDVDMNIGEHMSTSLVPTAAAKAAPRAEEEVVELEDKNVLYCVEKRTRTRRNGGVHRTQSQRCRRSRSAAPERRQADLRRSETDVGKMKGDEEDAEEFRRVIEAFIEKQLKFQREESMAIVSSRAPPPPLIIPALTSSSSAGTTVQVYMSRKYIKRN